MPLQDPVQEQAVSNYIRRLLSSVSRSAVLRAFPTRAVKRIDLSRFRVAHADAPEQMVEKLVQPSGRYRLVFEKQQSSEARAESQALFTALRTKLAREAQAAHRETGLWMLWLAYPLIYVPHPSSDHDDFLLAPLFLWPVRIEGAARIEGELLLSREQGAPRFNRIAWQWISRNLEFEPREPTSAELLELADIDGLRRLVSSCCEGFRPSLDTTLSSRIQSVPEQALLRSAAKPQLFNSGLLGLIQWENMELLADLENMHRMGALTGPAGDFLRERARTAAMPLEIPKEKDRFLVTDTDYSQERAVWMARREEGVVVHGPPGTGKSQVIVNIVADALARGEKVLVVCQKKAALDVVASRLRSEDVKLGDLFIQVDDAEGDRRRIIEMLREAAPKDAQAPGARAATAEEMEHLESQFEEYAKALFGDRHRHRLSFRTMLGRIAKIERQCADIRPVQQIRELLTDLDQDGLARLSDTLTRLEDLFWAADVRSNPWIDGRKDLSGDRYQVEEITADIDQVLPAAGTVDQWAGKTGPISGRLVGNLRAPQRGGKASRGFLVDFGSDSRREREVLARLGSRHRRWPICELGRRR